MTRRGFTLIELLVSVAIIALLIGLLLPSLGAARSTARSVVCASNTRQLAAANQLYAGEHDDRLAPGAADFLSNLRRWHGSRASTGEAFDPEGGALTPYVESAHASRAIRACPSFGTWAGDSDIAAAGAFEAAAGGYGYNNAYLGQTRDRDGALVSDATGAAVHSAARPGETTMFTDAAFVSERSASGLIEYSFAEPRFQVGSSVGSTAGWRLDPSVHFRHGEGLANAAWLDGHVSSHRRSATHSSGLYRVDAGELGLGWFGDADSNELFDLR
ncbi:MAG: prepilin-type N-terminal cleavage/methylation domain-containing protein [Planctomycetota bacterium]